MKAELDIQKILKKSEVSPPPQKRHTSVSPYKIKHNP
jgi:hypothetical protein